MTGFHMGPIFVSPALRYTLCVLLLFCARSCVTQVQVANVTTIVNRTMTNVNIPLDEFSLSPSIVESSNESNRISTRMSRIANPVNLKLCSESNITVDTIGIPTQFTDQSGNLSYILTNYSFSKNNILNACKGGGSPSPNTITSLSSADYYRFVEKLSNGKEAYIQVQFHDSLILENGYLSVGSGGELAEYYSPDEFCVHAIRGQDNDVKVEFKTCPVLQNRPILNKCCHHGTVLYFGDESATCVSDDTLEKWDVGYFDPKTEKPLPLAKVNPVYRYALINCDNIEPWEEDGCSIEFHPVTDNTAVFIGAYRTWEHLNSSVKMCFDRVLADDGTTHGLMLVCGGNDTNTGGDHKARVSIVYMTSMYIGAFFHFITSIVYLITWSKQNIHGRTLCSCTLSLFFMKVFMGTAHLLGLIGNKGKTTICVVNAIGAQYFMIASFTWLLVVNIDLWWTFRSIRPDATKGLKRLLMYSSLAWGFPLLVTGISLILEFTFSCRTSRIPIPEYGERYCFVTPWSQGYYVYYILSVLIAFSIVFAAATLIGLYSFKKDANNLRSNKRTEDKQTVLLFLKLGVVMGFSWIFEVISWAATKEDDENHIAWIVLDIYNALSGILIFIIFVCKKSTLNLLQQTYPQLKGLTTAFGKITTPFGGEASSASNNTNSTGVAGNPLYTNNGRSASVQKWDNKRVPDTVAYSTNGGRVNAAYDE